MSSGSAGSKPSSAETPTNPPQGRPFPIYWSYLPSIKIVRLPKGRYSPKVDERCFTYCSQSIRGRVDKREPWCRTICLRHVFAHEVSRVLSASDGQQQTAQTKHPLPPEGQHTPGLVEVIAGQPSEDHPAKKDEVRHWDEGYYLWLSKSRWAAQEKLDLMSSDLERQAEWQRHKEYTTKMWAEAEQQRASKGGHPAGVVSEPSQDGQKDSSPQRPPEEIVFLSRPFPDLTGQSILLPVPLPFPPIQAQVANLLAPTYKLLELTHESISSGSQIRFAQRIWEKAWTNEPFILAQNVCSRMWESWKKGPPDDSNTSK
ncbi:hypothetical protein AcV7_000046 [Taiwanofungus camphoratus]|nr:hypothetical protein AcV7_000046 [Antrodia cinnamomea]